MFYCVFISLVVFHVHIFCNRSKEAVLQALASTVNRVCWNISVLYRNSNCLLNTTNILCMFIFQDPTACHYMFQDDSYLTPRTSGEFVSVHSDVPDCAKDISCHLILNSNFCFWFLPQKLYSLSQESGRSAAKYFINTYPKYFQNDFAEPHVPVSNMTYL